jgi:hypothetical protein
MKRFFCESGITMKKKIVQFFCIALFFSVAQTACAINITTLLNRISRLDGVNKKDLKKYNLDLDIAINKVKGTTCKDLLRVAKRDLNYKYNRFRVEEDFKNEILKNDIAKKRMEQAKAESRPIVEVNEEENTAVLARIERERAERARLKQQEHEQAVRKEQERLEKERQEQIAEALRLEQKKKRVTLEEERTLKSSFNEMQNLFMEIFKKLTIDELSLTDFIVALGKNKKKIIISIRSFKNFINTEAVYSKVQKFYDQSFTKKALQKNVKLVFIMILRLYDALLYLAYNIAPSGSPLDQRDKKGALQFIQLVATDIILLIDNFYYKYKNFLTHDFLQNYDNGTLDIGNQTVPLHEPVIPLQTEERNSTVGAWPGLSWVTGTTVTVPALSSIHKKNYHKLIANWFNKMINVLGYTNHISPMTLSESETIEIELEEEQEELFELDELEEEQKIEFYKQIIEFFTDLSGFFKKQLNKYSSVDIDRLTGFLNEISSIAEILGQLNIQQELSEFLINILLRKIIALHDHISNVDNKKPATLENFKKFIEKNFDISDFDENEQKKWEELYKKENINKFFEPMAGDNSSVEQVNSITRFLLIDIFSSSKTALALFEKGLEEENPEIFSQIVKKEPVEQGEIAFQEENEPSTSQNVPVEEHIETEEPLQEVLTSAPKESYLLVDIPTSTTMPQISAAVTVPVEEYVETAETSEFSQEPVEETSDYSIFAKIDELLLQRPNTSLNTLKEVLRDVVNWQNKMREVLEQTHHDGIVYDDNVKSLNIQLKQIRNKLNGIKEYNLENSDLITLKQDMLQFINFFIEKMNKYKDFSKHREADTRWRTLLNPFVDGGAKTNQLIPKDVFLYCLRDRGEIIEQIKESKRSEERSGSFGASYYPVAYSYKENWKYFNEVVKFSSYYLKEENRKEAFNYAYIHLLELTLDKIMKYFNTEPEEEYVKTVQEYTTEETLVAREKKSLNMKKFL